MYLIAVEKCMQRGSSSLYCLVMPSSVLLLFVLPAIALTKKIRSSSTKRIVLHLFALKMQQCSFLSVRCLMPQLL